MACRTRPLRAVPRPSAASPRSSACSRAPACPGYSSPATTIGTAWRPAAGTRSSVRVATSRRPAGPGRACCRGTAVPAPPSSTWAARSGSWRSIRNGGSRTAPSPDPTSRCAADSEREVIDAVRAALRGAGSRTAVVVAHHPPVSGGPHGGHFEWQDHIFPLRHLKSWLWIPLPVLGSAYPIAREHGWSTQDVSGAPYRRMSAALDSAFAGAPPLIYAAGHDHALQVIAGTSVRYVLVSGAGTFGHLEHVATVDSTRFAESASGFMRVEFLHDGRARLGVTVVDSVGHGREEFALWLR